jgi:serine/threonine protein kinase
VYLVEEQETTELFVLKMIDMRMEGTIEEQKQAQKEISAEISIGMSLGRECKFLVRYYIKFNYENYCCLIMEYCVGGDL